jgi:phosphoglycolate phosphatase-like HAD superfamily hydrolase
MNIDLAFFDIDGTIIWRTSKDGINLKSSCFNHALNTVFELDNVNYLKILGKKIYGQTDRSILKLTLQELGYSTDDYYKNEDKLFEAVDEYFQRYQHKLQFKEYKRIPGAFELLEMLNKKRIRLGLVTGNIKKHSDWKMRGVEFGSFFTTGGFGDDGETRDEILKTALSRNDDIPLNKICHFGDSPQDIIAAEKFKLKVVTICDKGGGTHSRYELADVGYGLIIDSWFETDKIETYLKS